MTPANHSNPFRAEIEDLRARASDHPVLVGLQDTLPEYREHADLEPGLYFDGRPAPGIKLNQEYRVSVARIYSVTEEGTSMVGQCQVTAHVVNGSRTWRVRWYAHAPQQFWTCSLEDVNAWWLQVLDRHFERGGAPPQMPIAIEA